MTGYGEAHRGDNGVAIAVEVRTINNRYFKLSIRSSEGYGVLDPQVEAIVRSQIKRGTVQVNIRIDREPSPDDYRINDVVFTSYRRQLETLYDRLHVSESLRLESILSLPGVINEGPAKSVDVDAKWPLIEQTLGDAFGQLAQMRQAEGQAMADDLLANCQAISERLQQIQRRSPAVVEAYRERLTERMNKLLADYDVNVAPADVVREVGVFSERVDISEEIVRLKSHLGQVESTLATAESAGRKLEFLIQEMFRETNTIGSKANDAEIAQNVVEIKTGIERMREMVQNVE
jgi:uncharacterized protein (TIGR00255 family)